MMKMVIRIWCREHNLVGGVDYGGDGDVLVVKKRNCGSIGGEETKLL